MNKTSRRSFIRQASGIAALPVFSFPSFSDATRDSADRRKTTISHADLDFEREPLLRPFGFKGGFLHEIWQVAAAITSEGGTRKIGLGTQSVLWSDANVFAEHSESGGNALMYALTERALQMIKGQSFSDPIAFLDQLLPDVYEYGKRVTGRATLRKTFALNALVSVDNALWLLHAADNMITDFDELIPPLYRAAFSYRHKAVAAVPAMGYALPMEDIKQAAEDGYFFMKIKLGQPGSQDEMLEKDMERLAAIHRSLRDYRTTYTKDGKLPYYFDMNGRYENKDTLLRLLDHARRIGAFDQIVVVEEPFVEEMEIDVSDIDVRLAADETAHTDADARARIAMGYRAIALKPIAKTLSMTLKIGKLAHEMNIPCFCADLTVNPILVEWNKNIAARLAPFPGIELGLMETNGHQNYAAWKTMRGYHPMVSAPWANSTKGVFPLDAQYYQTSGGIFAPSPHYEQLFGHP